MADISKCAGTNCERRDTCYRFTVPDNPHRQSWMAFWQEPKPCSAYIPVKDAA